MKELAERDATGAVAVIYDEIRRFCGVPYVSSMQRHLATRPGWLEWVWAAVRPVFVSGRAQGTAWGVCERIEPLHLAPISRAALRVWGVEHEDEASIRAVCDSFMRASPTNLVLSGLLRKLLAGERPTGRGAHDSPWIPPSPVPALPALVDVARLPASEQRVVMSLGTPIEGEVFVPGLYRMLARWPHFIAHVATVLGPQLRDTATQGLCTRMLRALDAEIPGVFAALPALPASPHVPPSSEFDAVRAVLDGYRKTSPEMIVFSRAIRDALPG